MESKVKILGHPIHPMLIVFPLGLFATAVIFDIIRLAGGGPRWSEASFHMIGAGFIGGLVAAVPGAVDWFAIPANTRAKAIGLWHGLGNVVVVVLFIISFALRWQDPGSPRGGALVLSFVGIAIGLVTGWLGGELVDRLGVGVDDGARVDAQSSLKGPATPGPRGFDRAA